MLRERSGYILLAAMAVLASVLTLTSVSMSRAVTELLATRRSAAGYQAFHLAEAGLDAALADLTSRGATSTDIGNLVQEGMHSLPTLLNSSSATYQYELAGDPGSTLLRVIATGRSQELAVSKGIQTIVELPGNATPKPFDYAIATGRLDLQGAAQIGWDSSNPAQGGQASNTSGSGRVDLYIHDAYGHWGAASPDTQVIAANSNDRIWARRVDIVDRWNKSLSVMCTACSNSSIFPTAAQAYNEIPAAQPSPYFNCGDPSSCANVNTPPQLDLVEVDLNLFYEKAIQQCKDKGNTDADCRGTGLSGSRFNNKYNHITADTTITGGRTTPLVLEGVIYVEAGANLTLKNKITIHGTIVHEGTGSSIVGPGAIISSGELVIDSFAETDINADTITERAFAPGLAIAGSPRLDISGQLGNLASGQPGIKGFVMAASGFQSYYNNPSVITADGIIEGGVIGLDPIANDWYNQFAGGSYDHYLRPDVNGPVTYLGIIEPVYKFWLWDGKIQVQNAQIRFKPLDRSVPGLPQVSNSQDNQNPVGVTKPTLRFWAAD